MSDNGALMIVLNITTGTKERSKGIECCWRGRETLQASQSMLRQQDLRQMLLASAHNNGVTARMSDNGALMIVLNIVIGTKERSKGVECCWRGHEALQASQSMLRPQDLRQMLLAGVHNNGVKA